MRKGAIFDMDGTLLDSVPVWEHACEWYLERNGIAVREKLSEVLFSMSMREGAGYVREKYGLAESVEEIAEGVNGIVFEEYRLRVEPKPGVRDFLEELKSAGVKMAVATATDRPMAEAALERTGLISSFTGIFTCTETGAGKSRPDVYEEAAAHLGIEKEQIWVFEDALYAICTAKAAGFRTAGIYDAASEGDWEKITAEADICFCRWEDAAGFTNRPGIF